MSAVIESDKSLSSIGELQQRTTQCLVLGRYTAANVYALEACMIHLQSCFCSNTASPMDLWFELGIAIRLAFRMGYHRDPDSLAAITPFDGEMRRRVWLNIFQIDALFSFQCGFPSMIPTEFCDAKVPKNLEFSDFHVGMIKLPPSRPFSEHTPALYPILKASVMRVFKRIVEFTQSLSASGYQRISELDAEMNQVYQQTIPDSMKSRDVDQSLFMDHSCLIWQRCTIELLYLKGLVILHRRYVTVELRSPRFEYSRRACVEAALKILHRQADFHEACEPGGRLYQDRWMFASLPIHDFLLAAMVVCLDLSTSSGEINLQDLATREYKALLTTQRIWNASSPASPGAHMAVLALDVMLKKVSPLNEVTLVHNASPWDIVTLNDVELPYAGAMEQMIDGSEFVDWVRVDAQRDKSLLTRIQGLLDQYLQNMDVSILDIEV